MKKKNQEIIPETSDAAVDAGQENIAADVDAIMRKYDRESNTRIWSGRPKIVVGIILALFSLYCIYVTLFANFLEQVRLSSFLGLVIVMGYLTYPAKKGKMQTNYMPWYDILLMVLGAASFFYYTANAHTLLNTGLKLKLQDPVYIIAGIIGLVVLAELCRRSVGLPILCVVVVFIIFGAFLEKTGISAFFIELANGLTGKYAGGPAKVAVISSALCGMVSGSSVGNTVTTGSITIPMMKKTGYDKNFSGAVEAAASTGGQIMPPIMGAAAFLMADYLGVPYSDIIVRAILPACLYFLGVFLSVHLEAKRLGLKGLSRDDLPKVKELMKESYLLLPLFILIYLVCSQTMTMQSSAAWSIIATIVVGVISNYLRIRKVMKLTEKNDPAAKEEADKIEKQLFRPIHVFEALENGGRSCISVAVACGIAGLICGCLTVTGLASTVINAIVTISQGKLFLGLLLTMICCIILGMGIPTTATYCIMASTCAPILIQMGVPMICAHFFVFYYGIVADITPPVALAAYAGSAISGGSPMKTGVNATRLAIAGFIIPFIFAMSPDMLLVNTTWYEVALITVTSIIGMYGVTYGLSGFGDGEQNGAGRVSGICKRLISIAGGLLLIYPGIGTDIFGVALVGAVMLWRKFGNKDKDPTT